MDRIFINGIEIDQEQEKGINLVYQSPYFTEIDFIISNRTTSVDIPRTPNNIRAVEYSGIMQNATLFEYNIHEVMLYRDGVQLFRGTGTLLSITPQAYKFTFAWGNINAFQQMLDTNLRDLQTQDAGDYIGYNRTAVSANPTYYPSGWNTVQAWGYGVSGLSIQPIMPVSQIMGRLAERFGVSFSFPQGRDFNKYRVPLVTRFGDELSAEWQGAIFSRGGVGETTIGNNGGVRYLAGSGGAISVNEGIIDTTDIDTLVVQVPKGFQTQEVLEQFDFVTVGVGLQVMALEYDGAEATATILQTIPTVNKSTYNPSNGEKIYTYTVEQDVSYSVDVADYDEVVLAIAYKEPEDSVLDDSTLSQISIVVNSGVKVYNPDADTVSFGGSAVLPLYANLPDMSVADFLKNLMKLEGLFAYSTDDKEVRFVSLADLYNKRGVAQDWSNKVIAENGLPTETATTFNSLAQKNWMRYAEDEQVPANYNGYIVVYSALLEQENDLISVDFAPTEGNTIGVWVEGENGAEWHDVTPRILRVQADGAIGFRGMSWDSLITREYAEYQQAVKQLRTVKVVALLTTKDLLTYDPTTPIYVRQWGHYYAVTKLTTKDHRTAEVELLQLTN